VRPLSDHQFNQLYAGFLARVDGLGRTVSRDLGATRPVRKMFITIALPGLAPALGVADFARLEYEEWFRRTSIGWVRVRYHYNYLDLARGGRLGLHLHPLPTTRGVAVPHRICIQPDGSGEGRHDAAHEVELVVAHEQFERLLVTAAPIACEGLTRID
jgi:hypothetical protein